MPPKKPTRRTKAVADAPDPSLSPAGQIAQDILDQRYDLRPSVEAIMGAGLSDDDAVDALGLFRTALGQPGDPHRDPRVAIATVTGRTTA